MSYFKVGEGVILQSVCYPELNGDCVITSIDPVKRDTTFHDGTSKYTGSKGYYTTIPCPLGASWDETALRKKHKPSTKSLSTIIEELNKVEA